MTQDQARLLELIRADGHVEIAAFIDLLMARIEGLESQVRRLSNQTAGLAEHIDALICPVQ